MKTLVFGIVCALIIFLLGLLLFVTINELIKLKKEKKAEAKKKKIIKEKDAENEDRKKKLNTGNSIDDFNNSIDLLQNLSKR